MTQAADVEAPPGKAKLAIAITLFLGILLFMNYGAGKLGTSSPSRCGHGMST